MTTREQKKLNEAKVRFVMRFPFFAGLLCKREVIMTDQVPTAAVDDKGRIYANPEFIKSLDNDQIMFVLAHECMHAVFAHRLRIHDRDHFLWNVAGDAVINHMLKECSVGKPIDGMVDFDWVTDETTAEEVYEKLLKDGKKQKQKLSITMNDLTDKTPKQEGDPAGGGNRPTDSEVAAAIQEGKMEIAAAYQGEKLRGCGGGALGSIVEAMLKVKVPWYELLERYMVGKHRSGVTWNRPNKRYLRTAYLPGKTTTPAMGRVVIGVDTSGSIGDEEMAEFLGNVARICELCDPESVDILYTTDKVEEAEHFERGDYSFESRHNRWCGGTDMRAVTEWADDTYDGDVDVTIIFTDGYSPVPEECLSDVLWVLTTDVEMPRETVGDILRLN